MVTLADVVIDVEDGGPASSPEPVVLVHGWLGSRDTWRDVAPLLRTRHRTVAVDLRGHGRSSVPTDGYAAPDLAGDVAGVIERLGLGPATVMAHSMGTSVATVLAVRRPELVARLVLVDPDYGGDPGQRPSLQAMAELPDEELKTAVADMFRSRIDAPTRSAELRALHLRGVDAVPARVVAATLRGNLDRTVSIRFRPEAEAVLPRRLQPTLSFHRLPERAEWERRQARHPASRALVAHGAGHWIHEERPTWVVEQTERWLAGCCAPPPDESAENGAGTTGSER